jgi:DNA mismatch repair protein MutS
MSFTPMIRQYQAIKKTLSENTILFFRLGDFYEMFFEDALRASALLDITLTGRDGGAESRVPMCGIPYHAAQGYINKLTREGYKVAVCEQVEDPKLVKGIVKREIVRMVTPATNLEDETAEGSEFNYIAALYQLRGRWGLAYLDLATGVFRVGEFAGAHELQAELVRLQPRELVVSKRPEKNILSASALEREYTWVVNEYDDWVFDAEEAAGRILEQFHITSLASLGIAELPAATAAAGALLYYLKDNLHKSLSHLKKPLPFYATDYMVLDKPTLKNLELVSAAADAKSALSLFRILDETMTPLGARLLSQWVRQPLVSAAPVQERLNSVEELFRDQSTLTRLRSLLKSIRDIERLIARINCATPSARDIVALGASLETVPTVKEAVSSCASSLISGREAALHPFPRVTERIRSAFVEMPPFGVKEGGFIKAGYSPELDELRAISRNAKEWIANLQAREIEKTGIKSLKIKFNRVFGYYIEVTKTNLSMIPDYYQRKQTLVNAERFTVPELKEYEEKILGAEERACELEYRLFEQMRSFVLQHVAEIQETAEALAVLDVIAALAAAALKNNYTRPEVNDSPVISITGGRHPVVERMLGPGKFVENDIFLDSSESQLHIITGPNMAGKSTFIRQVALIVLMAQMGSFVPAAEARIGVVDRVFTRIGAADNIARGESTFMVEMNETANILHNATSRSLLVFDEIGRGTSTFDGVSIAWAVCEYLHQHPAVRPKTLFATHYHELTELGDRGDGIKNYNVTVKERPEGIIFLRRVVPGGADRSYGIHVAKLAGLPQEVLARAQEILLCLEEERITELSVSKILEKRREARSEPAPPLLNMIDRGREQERILEQLLPGTAPEQEAVLKDLSVLDPLSLTPLEALIKITQWKKELSEKKAEDTKKSG